MVHATLLRGRHPQKIRTGDSMFPTPVKNQKKRYSGVLFASVLAVIVIFASCGNDEATATPVADVVPTATPVADVAPTPTPIADVSPTSTPIIDIGPTPTPVVEEVEGSVYRNPKYPYSVVQPDGWEITEEDDFATVFVFSPETGAVLNAIVQIGAGEIHDLASFHAANLAALTDNLNNFRVVSEPISYGPFVGFPSLLWIYSFIEGGQQVLSVELAFIYQSDGYLISFDAPGGFNAEEARAIIESIRLY